MNNKNHKRGFTLAELLIEVAIIAVLVAIAIPVFSAQLKRAKVATTIANLRSAYAEASAAYLTGEPGNGHIIDASGSNNGVKFIYATEVNMQSNLDFMYEFNMSQAESEKWEHEYFDPLPFPVAGIIGCDVGEDIPIWFFFKEDGSVDTDCQGPEY